MKFLFSATAALSLVLADPGFVQLPLSVRKSNSTRGASDHSLHARSDTVSDAIANDFVAYYVTVGLGTPAQEQEVQIDTGSSDLWVYGAQSSGANQVYDPSKSSTSEYINNGFNISYVDGTGAVGDYYLDELSLGGVTVNTQFAVTEQPVDGDGVFGIATSANEADNDGRYANYPVALKENGVVESTAYSLYLDGLNANSGVLLFGGVDTSRYSGPLYTVPIVSKYSFEVEFEVEGQRLTGDLDSGTSFTYLPDEMADNLAKQVGATWSSVHNAYFVEKATDLTLTFNFSGATVTVPSSELFAEWQGGITFTIGPQSLYDSILLGDSFLRSAYVVYDLDNGQIAIAQADYNGSGSIEPITSAGIPGSQPAPGF